MADDREPAGEELPSSAAIERRTYSPTHGFADPSNPPQGGTGVPPKPSSPPAPARAESQQENAGTNTR
jgi:hypothetical protein